MPTFLDHHPQLPPLPPEAAERIRAGVKAGKRDEFGVRPINVFVGGKDGYCLTEAPDTAAVVASHKAHGFTLRKSDVKRVTPIA